MGTKNRRSGFTLVELLIVIVVIAILAAITIIAYNGITAKARTATLKSTLSQNVTLLGVATTENGAYPADQASASLKTSDGVTLTYTNPDGISYCLQADGWSQSWYVTNDNSTPVTGSCASFLPSPPAIASTGAFGHISSGTISVPVPSGVTAGSLVIIALHAMWHTSTLPTTAALSLPSGWSAGPMYAYYETGDSYASGLFFAYKYATGTDSGTYAIGFNNVGGVSVDGTYPLAAASRITGGPTSGNPFVDATRGNGLSGGNPISIATFTPGGNNSLLIAVLGAEWGSINPTGPSGWSKVADSASNLDTELWDTSQTTVASTGTVSWDYGQPIDGLGVLIGTIRP